MKCPKCGLEQTQSDECSGCGIIIRKYLERQSDPAGKSTKKPSRKRGRQTHYGLLQIERELRDFYQSQFALLNAGLTPLSAITNFLGESENIKDLLPYRQIHEVLMS